MREKAYIAVSMGVMAGMLLGLAIASSRAEYEARNTATLTCSLCRRAVPSTGHILVLAENHANLYGDPHARRWGFCERCWPRAQKEVRALMARLSQELNEGEKR